MAPVGPVDLIRLEGEGTSVIVRITGREPAGDDAAPLAAEILVDTGFVRGGLTARLGPRDLTEWQEALDALDTGADIGWREGSGAAGLSVALDPDGGPAHVTVADDASPPVCVTVAFELTDAWFDDAYRRLEEVLRVWP